MAMFNINLVSRLANFGDIAQEIFHFMPENLLYYEVMTSPSLQKRWQTQPQRGELIGVSASVENTMIGLVVAECWQEDGQHRNELISSYVLPAYRQHAIEQQMQQRLQRILNTNNNKSQF